MPRGTNDPAFATKPKIAARLVGKALQAQIPFTAVVGDCAYGDNDDYRRELRQLGLAYVLALKRRKGLWAPACADHTPIDAARALVWGGPDDPADWTRVQRRFRDGHHETWWAADARLGPWGPDEPYRLVIATTDPATLPDKSTWYLTTNLPRPHGSAAADSSHPQPISRRSCACTAYAAGSSRATNRSRTSSAGPTSRSAPRWRSAATKPW
ncbi:transposase [Streptosporangium lutulentum]